MVFKCYDILNVVSSPFDMFLEYSFKITLDFLCR